MLASVICFRLNKNKINQSIALFVFSIVIAFTFNCSSFLNLKKLKFTDCIKKKVELFAEQRQFSFKRSKNIVEKIFKKVLLLNTMKLFKEFRSKVDIQLLRVFNVVVAFIFNIENYFVAICICVEILSV